MMEEQVMWAVISAPGILGGRVHYTRDSAIKEARRTFMRSWESLYEDGFRVVRVSVREKNDEI